MPYLGLGVYQSKNGQEVANAVHWALKTGYRHIDTAAIYRNEDGVGQGIKISNVPREDVFVVSKVWNSDQGYDSTLRAIQTEKCTSHWRQQFFKAPIGGFDGKCKDNPNGEPNGIPPSSSSTRLD